MSPSPAITIALIAVVAVVSFALIVAYPGEEEPDEGRVLAYVKIQDAEAGFQNTTTFTVDHAYERISLSYIITEAAHVRALVSDPDGLDHQAEAIRDPQGDRLELEVRRPPMGEWGFTIWTLDEQESQGYIDTGEFYILGFGGPDATR